MTISNQDFELLLKANKVLTSSLDIDNVLQSVLEFATQVVQAEASSLLLLDAKNNELYFNVALGSAKDSVKEIRLKVGEGIAGWVAKEKKPLIVNDVSKDERFTQKVDKSTKFKTESILAVPLIAKDKLVGVIEAINKKKGKFSESDKEVFQVFANQSASAIENAQLFSEISHEKEKLNMVFSEMQDGVLLLDDGGEVMILNQTGVRLIGHGMVDLAHKKFGDEIFDQFDQAPKLEDLKKVSEEGYIFELSRTKGKDLILDLYGRKLEFGGYIFVMRDVTEERRGEKLKRDFLSLMSHKLKTPLTVIMGYAPILVADADKLSEFQAKAANSISEQAENLAGLVDKLLNFSIIESEEIDQSREEQSIKAMINDASSNLEGILKAKSGKIVIDPSVDKIPPIKVDKRLTTEVIRNLIENGIKFNEQKERTVTISSPMQDQYISIQFSDNGVGIPPEEFERIFEKFYQVENSFTGQVPGAGLGLALCKKVVEAMGGEITLESNVGKGSTFTITLPSH